MHELRLSVALDNGHSEGVAALSAIDIDELVLVDAPPEDPRAVADWIGGLARRCSTSAR
jgi:hypothetical protein